MQRSMKVFHISFTVFYWGHREAWGKGGYEERDQHFCFCCVQFEIQEVKSSWRLPKVKREVKTGGISLGTVDV